MLERALCGAAMDGLVRFDVKPSPMFGVVDCEGCHDLSQPLSIETMDETCMDCHDDDESYEGMLAGWMENLAKARNEAEQSLADLEKMFTGDDRLEQSGELQSLLTQNRTALRLLKEAGPHHNPDAAMRIYSVISQQSKQSEPDSQTD